MSYNEVIEEYNDIKNIDKALSLLNWDQSTYMPEHGVESRSESMATLAKLSHEKFTSEKFYKNICEVYEQQDKLNDDQKKVIIKIKRNVDQGRKIPPGLAEDIARTTSIAINVWAEAKRNNNDKEFLPLLSKIFELKKQVADLLGYETNPYDALLDDYDRGLKYSYIKPVFENLEKELSFILGKIKSSGKKIKNDFIFKNFDTKKQWSFGETILKKMGIDFKSFRQDMSAHPFTTTIGYGDVRITTDIVINNFTKGLYSTIHEGGHTLYELGVASIFKDSPFAELESLSLHESQSRLYENIVGRSIGFWETYYPGLQKIFPENLKSIGLLEFYEAINKVELTPVRIESDEVTYNLHIVLRTEIENALINNHIKINSIEEFWNEKMKKIFGFTPKNKSEGYLQDIHWADGLIGYFPTYAMGNLISAQFYNKMKADLKNFEKFTENDFKNMYNWLSKNLYSKGSLYTSSETVKMISGEDLKSAYFVDYIKNKFEKIYG